MKTSKQPERERFTRDQIRSVIESIAIRAESTAPLCKSDPRQFVRETRVRVSANAGCRPSDYVEIGEARLLHIKGNCARYDYNCPIFYVVDAHSQDLRDVYQAFFKDREEWIDEVCACDIFDDDFLYIDYICLKPEYRGYGIGRILAMGFIEEFAKAGEIVVARPTPVELEEEAGAQIVRRRREEETVTPKLVALCESLGFIRIDGTNMLFLPMTEQYPNVLDILKKMFPGNRKTFKGRGSGMWRFRLSRDALSPFPTIQ